MSATAAFVRGVGMRGGKCVEFMEFGDLFSWVHTICDASRKLREGKREATQPPPLPAMNPCPSKALNTLSPLHAPHRCTTHKARRPGRCLARKRPGTCRSGGSLNFIK